MWRCASSQVDPRFTECRGTFRQAGATVTVTGSLLEGAAAVLLVAASLDGDAGAAWLRDLATRYGDVAPRQRHGQTSWQWVRRGRMIRLTTRPEAGRHLVSVSLVDGHLLDALDPPPGRP